MLLPVRLAAGALTLVATFAAAARAGAGDVYLPPAAFTPVSAGAPFAIDQGGLGCLRVPKGSAFLVAVLPARGGDAVEEITALVEDVNADALAVLTLARRRPKSFEVVGMTPASQGSGGVEELALRPSPPVVVGAEEALVVQLLITGPDVCLHGVRARLRPAAAE